MARASLTPQDMSGNPIQNLPTTPSGANDAASKSYVDTQRDTRQPSSTALTNLAAVSTAGSLHRTGTDTYAARTLTGTANLITVTNGTGATGNPTFTVGTSVLRTDTAQSISGIKTFSATPIISTLTGYVRANGASALTAATTIPLADIGATGTKDGTTYLRGDGTWSAVPASPGTNLGNTPAVSTVAITSSTGTGTTLPAATTSVAGVMTSADKSKLNGIDAGAQVNSFVRVVHGATASTARPGATHVEWVGSVAPTNGTTADTWIDTA